MSIKRYLFILIGGIVVGVAALQLILITYFQQHLNDEIVQKSRQLSTQIIEFAVDNVNLESENLVFVSNGFDTRIKQVTSDDHVIIDQIHQSATALSDDNSVVTRSSNNSDETNKSPEHITTSVQIKCEEDVQIKQHTDPDASTVKIEHRTFSEDDLKQQKILWKKKLHKIITEKHQASDNVTKMSFVAATPAQLKNTEHFQHDILSGHEQQSTAVESLVNYMIYLILGSSLLALFLALWLSNHFTRPLQKLSKGFASLEKGEFGVQVESAGINEYRKTISSFNHMSVQLAQLAESEKTLQQQGHLAELGEVSRGLAHALRNPMHTIGLSVEQLKDPALPEKLKSKLQDKIQAKIKHIDKTIKAMLTLTSSEIRRNDDVPVRSVIQDIILELKSNGQPVQINLNTDTQNLTLKGAESEIRAILHTLIVNAVEANNHQGEVSITLKAHNDTIVVEVTDQGNGIDPAIAQRLFQPHVSSKAEGAGMGLYISRRLATLYYNGDITLADNDATGCTATVTLQKGIKND